MKTAVIILGHGSKNLQDDMAIRQIVSAMKESGGADIVEYAYLQYSQPSPGVTVERCVQQGADTIVVVPFFLQAGTHVRRDIPALLNEMKQKHLHLDIRATDYVGAHPLMNEIVKDLINKK